MHTARNLTLEDYYLLNQLHSAAPPEVDAIEGEDEEDELDDEEDDEEDEALIVEGADDDEDEDVDDEEDDVDDTDAE